MNVKRIIANLALKRFGVRRLANGRIQKMIRSVLDEIDFQHLRDSNPCQQCNDRFEMYRYINLSLVRQKPIDYLEFGVHRGDSIREWACINEDKCSRFYGFDSFEGLPEIWRKNQGAGHFNLDGNIPQINDDRILYIKGWFDKTVPVFLKEFKAQNQLVVHFDADLYSSTLLPLIYLIPHLSKGDLLIFDEFYDRDHEFKAFHDFQKVSKISYRMISQMQNYGKICVELL